MSKKKYEPNIALKFLNKAIDDSIPGFREVIEVAQEYTENNGIHRKTTASVYHDYCKMQECMCSRGTII